MAIQIGNALTGTNAAQPLGGMPPPAAGQTAATGAPKDTFEAGKQVGAGAPAGQTSLEEGIGKLLEGLKALLEGLMSLFNKGGGAGGANAQPQLNAAAPAGGAAGGVSAEQKAAGKQEITSKLTTYAMGNQLLGKTPLAKKFDGNGDGGLDANELQQMLSAAGVGGTSGVPVATYAQGMMQELDKNGDGKMAFSEFEAAN